MSTVILTKWGNSVGVCIPASIIKEAHLAPGTKLEITSDDKSVLTLIPIKNKQQGWLDKFNAVADSEDAHLDIANDFDADEWTW